MNTPAGRRTIGEELVLDVACFAALLGVLRAAGYRIVGPTVRDDAIVLR